MQAGIWDFTVQKGATLSCQLVFTDSAGDAIDLSDYTARMQVRRADNNELVATPTCTIIGNKVEIALTAADTSNLPAVPCKHDLKLESDSATHRYIQGDVVISEQVTV